MPSLIRYEKIFLFRAVKRQYVLAMLVIDFGYFFISDTIDFGCSISEFFLFRNAECCYFGRSQFTY
jgi:hypothetical protein